MTSGTLEILHYVPPALRKDFRPEEAELEEFIRYLAMARYIAELDEITLINAIRKALQTE